MTIDKERKMDYQKLMQNASYSVTANSFEPFKPEKIGGRNGIPVETGAVVQPNGDIIFRMIAPEADSVKVVFSATVRGEKGYTIPLVKGENGVFEGILPHCDTEVGPRDFSFVVDGARVLSSTCPVYFRMNRITNYVELPDPGFPLARIEEVPHGSIQYRTYWSEVFHAWKRCLVYLPYEYEHSPRKKYPVLFLNNVGTENETTWTYAGKCPEIMDNLIEQELAVPMIVVMCNTMVRLPEEKSRHREELFGWREMIVRDVIPFIDREYRTYGDKAHRAMCGNSMGGMATSFAGFAHPELFSALGFLSSSIRAFDFQPDFADNHQLDWLVGHPERAEEAYRVIFRGMGDSERYYTDENSNDARDSAWLKENGIDRHPGYVRKVYEGGFYHEWPTFRREFADFVQLLFKA